MAMPMNSIASTMTAIVQWSSREKSGKRGAMCQPPLPGWTALGAFFSVARRVKDTA